VSQPRVKFSGPVTLLEHAHVWQSGKRRSGERRRNPGPRWSQHAGFSESETARLSRRVLPHHHFQRAMGSGKGLAHPLTRDHFARTWERAAEAC